MFEELLKESINQGQKAKGLKERFLYNKIKVYLDGFLGSRKEPKTILLSGLRGIGKTTLLRQVILNYRNALYISADSFLLKRKSLFEIADLVSRNNIKILLIDEVHNYSGWMEELKNIYDSLDLFVIATGSSNISIEKGAIFLGRRALKIDLTPLTFQEFIYLKYNKLYKINLKLILDKNDLFVWLSDKNLFLEFKEYLQVGGFPFVFNNSEPEMMLLNNVKRMLYKDVLSEFNISESKIDIMEKLLTFIALSKAGDFSIESFCNNIGRGKSSVYDALELLLKLKLLVKVKEPEVKGNLRDTYKLIFYHPNMRSAILKDLKESLDIGALQEEYFSFHSLVYGFKLNIPKKAKKTPDFLLEINKKKYVFEIGTKNKKHKQIKGLENAHIMTEEELIAFGFLSFS